MLPFCYHVAMDAPRMISGFEPLPQPANNPHTGATVKSFA
jgi:hypothetical protein